MNYLIWLAALLLPYQVQAAKVFAHFMVGNVEQYTKNDWLNDIVLAQSVGIDAFALNIAAGTSFNDAQIDLAFSVAEEQFALYGFQLFFSFDYAGNGAWPEQEVIDLISRKSSSAAHYQYNGKPFVSTFEGPANAEDWHNIKSETGCFFVPNWSSSGATVAVKLADGVADGLFSWAAWPYANQDMSTYIDASFSLALGDKPYMMPVSPWFYTNLPGYDKDWMWNGDNLWYDRWIQAISYAKGGYNAPEWIEILTWNDYGESHHIGPLDDRQYDLFTIGKAPYNYAENLPHDGWRTQLKWMTSLYKTGKAASGSESVVAWYRTSYKDACADGGTTGGTASQLQQEITASQITKDQISISALLTGPTNKVKVLFGAYSYDVDWKYTPEGGAGLYYAVLPLDGADAVGGFAIYITRGSDTIIVLETSVGVTHTCTNGITNWNPVVASALGSAVVDIEQNVSDHVCVKGWGLGEFADLCEFTCGLGYCPMSACVCSQFGAEPDQPTDGGTPVDGYPANGDPDWDGLCSFACGLGEKYCYPAFCSQTKQPEVIPTVSPFTPAACTGGSGTSDFAELCAWSCAYGYCPINGCDCSAVGDLVLAPDPIAGITANFTPIADNWRYNDLCTWTCSRGFCPDVCESSSTVVSGCVSGSGDGNLGGLCGYSCGRGYCPEPCVCAATGQVEIPKADSAITGYGADGLDHDIYDKLCAFTCSHGYCPSPNACVEVFVPLKSSSTIDSITLPTLQSYVVTPLANVTNVAGDSFRFQSADDPNISVNVVLLGEPTELPEATCDLATPGANGNALGCIGETTEFLLLSLMEDSVALQNRDLSGNSNTFLAHREWEAQPNCSMHCRLLNEAPLNTWISVGNGTHYNRPHELHFMNTGKSLTYKASGAATAVSNTSTHEKRIVPLLYFGAAAIFGITSSSIGLSQISNEQRINNRPILASVGTVAVMETAKEHFLESCLYFNDNDTSVVAANTTPDGIAFIISSSGKLGETMILSADEADSYTKTCTEESKQKEPYIVYPVNGLDIDSLKALLESYPEANLVEHVSINGHGMLFWEADLTMPQVMEVTDDKQSWEVEAGCASSCPNPKDGFYDKAFVRKPIRINRPRTSAQLKGRDSGFLTEEDYDVNGAFVSDPPGGGRSEDYVHDGSSGNGVYAYILDPEPFDLTLDEFSLELDDNLESLVEKAVFMTAGRPGYVPSAPIPRQSHGTAMLAVMAGGTHGIAYKIHPILVNWEYSASWAFILVGLDKIEADWPARKASMSSNLAPLGVLSMSFGVESNSYPSGAFPQKFGEALNRLAAIGILPVTSAGNDAEVIHKFPEKLGDPTHPAHVPSLVVVGAVDQDGVQWTSSNTAPYVDVWGPGVNNEIPIYSFRNEQETYKVSGTSISAARTAGLAAYFIGLSSLQSTLISPAALKQFIIDSAYQRSSSPNLCIYNNVPFSI